MARAAALAERARQQARNRQETAGRRELREAERAAKADARDAARDHLAAQMEESETLTREVSDRETAIETLLARALAANPAIDLQAKIKKPSSLPNLMNYPGPPVRLRNLRFIRSLPDSLAELFQVLPNATRREL
ncbi:MAG TPA: hypothetical protein VGG99_13980 [Acetobacteraceae bacterium]